MNKKPNKNRTGLLIGIGSIFLTITVAGVILTSQISKHHSMHDSGNGMNQTMEDILSETDTDERDDYLLDDEESDVDDAKDAGFEDTTESEKVLARIRYSDDGRPYTPFASISDWDGASREKRESYIASSIPVLEDWNETIESICVDSLSRSSRSYILGRQLYSWCEKQGMQASAGEYLAYRNYIGQGKESFYVELDDDVRTIIVCQSISHGLYWKFSVAEESRDEVEQLREAEQMDRKQAR